MSQGPLRTMATHKPTTDRRQALTFLGILASVSAFFGYAILPYMDPARSPLLGQRAPDFTLPVIFGGEPGNRWALSDHQGKVVILDFWASWCAPCRAQVPIVQRIAKRFSDVEVVGVNTSDKMEAAVKFAHSVKLSYVSLFDSQGAIADAFGATALPTLVVINAAGQVVAFEQRVVHEDELARLIEEARKS